MPPRAEPVPTHLANAASPFARPHPAAAADADGAAAGAAAGGGAPRAAPKLSFNEPITTSMGILLVPLAGRIPGSEEQCRGTKAPLLSKAQLEAQLYQDASPERVTVASSCEPRRRPCCCIAQSAAGARLPLGSSHRAGQPTACVSCEGAAYVATPPPALHACRQLVLPRTDAGRPNQQRGGRCRGAALQWHHRVSAAACLACMRH